MKVILFDIDGTLIDSGEAPKRAFDAAFELLFEVSPISDGITIHGSTDPKIHRDIANATLQRDLTVEEATLLVDKYIERLAVEIMQEPEYKVLPGVHDLLTWLSNQDDLVIGLQTGNVEQAVEYKLGRGNIRHFFSFGGFGTDSELRSEIILAATRRAQDLNPSNVFSSKDVYIVGDSPQDIQAGKAAGVNTIGVSSGVYPRKRLEEEFPTYLLDSLTDREMFGAAIELW